MVKKAIIYLMILGTSFLLQPVFLEAQELEEQTSSLVTELPEELKVQSNNIILYNLNDKEIVYYKNKDEKVAIASLTKIMTAVVAIESVEDLGREVEITEAMVQGYEEYVKAGFKVGDVVTYEELLYGLILPSGADAALALALTITDSSAEYADLMNNKAQELNLTNTHFTNPIGEDDPDNYSTVQDLANLLLYALENEEFYKIYTTKEYTISSLNLKLESTVSKYNNLDTSIIQGAKSGYTDMAGLCLSSISTIDDVRYLLVTVGALAKTGQPLHIYDAINIYNYFSKNYSYQVVLAEDQEIGKIKIIDGFEKEYVIKAPSNLELYLKNDINLDELTYTYQGLEELDYRIKTGTKLGVVAINYRDELLYEYDVFLDEEIKYRYTKFLLLSVLLATIICLLGGQIVKKIGKTRRKKLCQS